MYICNVSYKMNDKKKKSKPKSIEKKEPKKRLGENDSVKKKPIENKKMNTIEDKSKVKKSEDKYIRIALDAPLEERKPIVEKVINGELKLAYFAVDNDKGYHYYQVIK